MPLYSAPGVYIEEMATGPRPIEGVGTSTAGFIGVAPARNQHVHKLRWYDNWTQFVKELVPDDPAKVQSTPLSHAVFGFFQNGGSRCAVVNVGDDNSIEGGGLTRKGLALFEEADEIAIVAAPGFTDVSSYEALLSHCEKLGDRVAVLDSPAAVSRVNALTVVGTVAAPATRRQGGGAMERPAAAEGEGEAEGVGLRPRQSPGGYGAFYFPWIVVRDPFLVGGGAEGRVTVPPSGHIAGIYARTDSTRGVHKAPGNEVIRGALGLAYRVTRQEQEFLNPAGVNCIRFFPNEGIRVYGARTLAESSSEWRYLNVRRLFNMIEESIGRGTRWVVFEPNDRSLWKSICRDISAFLTVIWRQGALMGRTQEEAFFVKCDDETNTPEEINQGRVVTIIGLAPVKPAEFVVFRIGQGVGGTEVAAQS